MSAHSDILIKMEQYTDGWKANNDLRHIFLSCYRLMTANMMEAIDRDEFHDTKWVDKLLGLFSDYYFDGLECYECGKVNPVVWQQTHNITIEKELHEVQYLMMGVNAHINYDLVLTLYDMLAPEWNSLSETARRNRYEDHCHVNDIIAATIDKVQDEVLEPLSPSLDWIDKVFGRVDEYLISYLISGWREAVWVNTQQLLTLSNEFEREMFRQQLEFDVVQRGNLISVFRE